MRLPADFKKLVFLAAAVAGIASRSNAEIITVPAGLDPGDTYRLVFVTSTTRDATSSDIDDYNTFVSNVAATVPDLFGLGATWYAIASTNAGVRAGINIGTSLPEVGIYRLDGVKVANGAAPGYGGNNGVGLFSGSIQAPINITEEGEQWVGLVWTGSWESGNGSYYPLGGDPGQHGWSGSMNTHWMMNGIGSSTEALPLYAISSEILVEGDSVPEPGSIGVTALGGAILLLVMRRRQKDHLVA